jgi:nucleotide-binding universal stress UspA family protein
MKILIATGGSAHSNQAICSGVEIARNTNGLITVLTIIKEPGKRAEAQAIVDEAIILARRVCEESGHDESKIQMEARVRLGHPAEEIVSAAIEGNYDLIVVGTWPKHNLLHRLLAPTTERVVMQAPCPVLVAKGRLEPLGHVLLCVSGAKTPSRAACFLRDLANQMTEDLHITVLHVMSQISAGPAAPEDWQLEASAEKLMQASTPEGQWLRQEIEILNGSKANVQAKVRHGLVVDEVLMEVLDSDCDLLVIGAHGQVGWQRFLLDDLTHQIIVRADRPVLVV